MFLKLLISVSLLFTLTLDPTDGDPAPEWTNYELVAHGLGEIDSYTYTNTLEAFELNYGKGHRLFEVDLQLTSDNYLISRHDWEPYLYKRFEQEAPPEGLEGKPLTREAIKSLKVHKSYQILDFEELLGLLKKYPDVYFITDTKDMDSKLVEKQFQAMITAAGEDLSLLQRVIPQVYNQNMYHQVDAMFQFPSYIYTLYMSPDTQKQVLSFVKDNSRIDAVTMPETLAKSYFLKQLKRAGVKTYVHTINDTNKMHDYLRQGTYGFYTDSITYDEFETVRIEPAKSLNVWQAALKNIFLLPIVRPIMDLL
ncbi:phosphatidylinositol-specific phospholipase C/glycerophosphodiester phosphodiesterase family protein [Paenibacillus spongiae]|uniref:Glycerophosphodiester phosphodiesterase n=1 Tax=Paenibacillus spongiae TaxID=2909671 RepID=A0ABY5S3Q5_9BACL|nr:phosphatidylinositol-specific phospholipase C/glycerophosphodiester phosphodiesterase family protein [Paenibacillus spongiae]UVI28526.1 glycerophosphodiester phosphodiesterase [Paenibacillus spongiae]